MENKNDPHLELRRASTQYQTDSGTRRNSESPIWNRILDAVGPIIGVLMILVVLWTPLLAQGQPPNKIKQIWAALIREADITTVLQAATVHTQSSQLNALQSQSRWYAALPKKVSIRVQQHQDDGWRGTLYDDEGWSHRSLKDTRLGWRLEAEWALSEMVYNTNLLAVKRYRRQQKQFVRECLDEVTRIYFERRQLQLLYMIHSSTEPLERSKQWVKIQELSARLDRMTGGLLGKKGVKWWVPIKN